VATQAWRILRELEDLELVVRKHLCAVAARWRKRRTA
jgi:hypothetical protein